MVRGAFEILPTTSSHGKITLLLTVSEDRATLRSDPSAGTEVSRKGDAVASLFLFVASVTIALSGNPKAINLGGAGG